MHIAIQKFNNCLQAPQDDMKPSEDKLIEDRPSLAAIVTQSESSISEFKMGIKKIMSDHFIDLVHSIFQKNEVSQEDIQNMV